MISNKTASSKPVISSCGPAYQDKCCLLIFYNSTQMLGSLIASNYITKLLSEIFSVAVRQDSRLGSEVS